MPKENIYSDSPEFIRVEGQGELPADKWPSWGTTAPVERRGVHVGWHRNRFIEIGVASFAIATGEHTEGHFASLDRDGVNRLIRSLRKARDQAYGKDE